MKRFLDLNLYRRSFDLIRDNPSLFFRAVLRNFTPLQKPYNVRLNKSLSEWLIYHETLLKKGRCRWMGTPVLRNPLDLWIFQEIISDVKPTRIVEIGSFKGGGTLFLAHVLDQVSPQGLVISIDLNHEQFQTDAPNIIKITGHSEDMSVYKRVKDLCFDQKTLVIHDGDHRYESVNRDLGLYCSLVTQGSYMIVEDSIFDILRPGDGLGFASKGPLFAINDFLTTHPEFEVDLEREKFLATSNPKGYLKKK